MNTHTVSADGRIRVGVVVVHGIGEQRRFEHVDGQVRQIIGALQARAGTAVTPEIGAVDGGAFHATSDSWDTACPVRLYVDDTISGKRYLLEFIEVWWADVNEPYSLMKQIRFWMWTLAIWLYPGKDASNLATASSVVPPHVQPHVGWWVRIRLFGIAFVAVVATASIGVATFVAERILKLQPPDIVRTFVNYVAGVKLYNQKRRMAPGFPPKPQDFLDTTGEPPRVSVRRRMIRILLAAGCAGYERWYVLAHSLGSVIAFNGLMETAYAWPGYIDRAAWVDAAATSDPYVGPARVGWAAPTGEAVPKRPLWVAQADVAYRSKIFRRFRGLLTFGSPLDKFAAIWPARVPISREPAFRWGTEWINIYDPTDPVSGALRYFSDGAPNCCPRPRNCGFAAGSVLLLSHIQYLRATKDHDGLADGIAEWLLSGSSEKIGTGHNWFCPNSGRHHRRSVLAWTTWVAVVMLLAVIGGVVYPVLGSAISASMCATKRHLIEVNAPVLGWLRCADSGQFEPQR